MPGSSSDAGATPFSSIRPTRIQPYTQASIRVDRHIVTTLVHSSHPYHQGALGTSFAVWACRNTTAIFPPNLLPLLVHSTAGIDETTTLVNFVTFDDAARLIDN